MSKKLTPPIKYHGGKHQLADWILSHAPPRVKNHNKPAPSDKGYVHYVEPYCGGCAVLLRNDPNGISEVINDIDHELTDFWRALADVNMFELFQRTVQAIPFSQYEWMASCGGGAFMPGRAARAIAFFVRCRQSMSGRMDCFSPLTRTRARRGMNEQASSWLNAIEGLPEVHARMMRVVVLNDDALAVIKREDGPRTWTYADPPYIADTRTAPNVYAHEMTLAQHADLLDVLAGIKGRFTLSGYRTPLYDAQAKKHGWRRVDKEIPNSAAKSKTKRKMIESLWMNY